jgi:nitroreductase
MSDMEFSELVKHRQSDRKYSDKPVEKEKILKCIETVRLSPSASNSQPWKFIIIDEPDLKNQIADCAASLGMNKFTLQSPVIIALVQEQMNILTLLGSKIKKKDFSLLDIGIAVNQFCLQAADLGLGTCIIGWFDEPRVKKLLHIDRTKRVQLLIALGYSEAQNRKKVRKPIDEMCSWNKY